MGATPTCGLKQRRNAPAIESSEVTTEPASSREREEHTADFSSAPAPHGGPVGCSNSKSECIHHVPETPAVTPVFPQSVSQIRFASSSSSQEHGMQEADEKTTPARSRSNSGNNSSQYGRAPTTVFAGPPTELATGRKAAGSSSGNARQQC